MNRYARLQRNAKRPLMTIIEIRPYRNGWEVFESVGVQPVFPTKEQAIDYATCRACFRSGEIRILDSDGAIECIITFDETDRRPVVAAAPCLGIHELVIEPVQLRLLFSF